MRKIHYLTMLVCLFALSMLAPQMVKAQGSEPPLSNYFDPVTTPSTTPDADGFITRWLLLEPITKPNPTNTVFVDSYLREAFYHEYFKDQFTILPKDGQKVTVDYQGLKIYEPVFRAMPGQKAEPKLLKTLNKEKLAWHALDSKRFNVKLFRFASGLDPEKVYGVLFWAVTVIDCEEEIKDVRLSVGSNSASMWWLNGEEAVILSGDRRMVQDDCASARLTLKKGRNILRGAVINGPGMSDFCVRFLDENRQPVTNIKVTTSQK